MLRLHGKEYPARWVSPEAVLAFRAALQTDTIDRRGQRAALAVLFRAMFPWRWRYLFGDPVRWILRLDTDAQGALLRDFFEHRLSQTNSEPPTTGTDSQN